MRLSPFSVILASATLSLALPVSAATSAPTNQLDVSARLVQLVLQIAALENQSHGHVLGVSTGAQITTTDRLTVRATPSGRKIGTQPKGAAGTISDGPVASRGTTWWKVNYSSGVDGWSAGNYLVENSPVPLPPVVATSTPSTPPPITSGTNTGTTTSTTPTTTPTPTPIPTPGPVSSGNSVSVSSVSSLNAALVSATAGETILLAPGTYAGVSITGLDSKGIVTIASQDSSNPAVITSMTLTNSTGFAFSNLTFSTSGSADPYYGFRVYTSNNISFSNISVHGSLDNDPSNDISGFLISGGTGISFTNSLFQQLSTALVFQGVTNETVSGNSFHDIDSDGIDNSVGTNVTLSGNKFWNFAPTSGAHPDAMQFWTSGTTQSSSNIRIDGNQVSRGTGSAIQGVFVADEVGTVPYQTVAITNNTLTGTLYNGILVSHASNLTISGNKVDGLADIVSWILVTGVTGGSLSNNSAQYYTLSGNTNLTETNDVVISAATSAPGF